MIVCAVMPHWRSLEAQDGWGKQRQDNLYAGVDDPQRGGSFVEEYYIRDADMNLAHIPEGVTLEQAVMVPDMMCTAFEGVRQLDPAFGASVAVLGIGPVGLMAVRAAVLRGAGKVFAIGSRKGLLRGGPGLWRHPPGGLPPRGLPPADPDGQRRPGGWGGPLRRRRGGAEQGPPS